MSKARVFIVDDTSASKSANLEGATSAATPSSSPIARRLTEPSLAAGPAKSGGGRKQFQRRRSPCSALIIVLVVFVVARS